MLLASSGAQTKTQCFFQKSIPTTMWQNSDKDVKSLIQVCHALQEVGTIMEYRFHEYM